MKMAARRDPARTVVDRGLVVGLQLSVQQAGPVGLAAVGIASAVGADRCCSGAVPPQPPVAGGLRFDHVLGRVAHDQTIPGQGGR
ncbi:MAG: hypothetical protein Q7U28_02195 [Aquabacterium sp.]|nr:hypothetical protein [Aquabacterium sp.]